MLIEQIIEFKLRDPGPPRPTCAIQLVIFMTKKSLRKNFEWMNIYCQYIGGGNVPFFSLPGSNH